MRHLPGAPRRCGLGQEGQRHGEADKEPGRGRLEARQSRQAPLQLESSSPKEKAQHQGCSCIPSPLSVLHRQLPGQCCPRSLTRDCSLSSWGCRSQPESRWPRLAILAGCDINQKLRLFCNFWNGFESLLRSCFIFFIFLTFPLSNSWSHSSMTVLL